ncbi:MAG: hypothetical protein ACR2NL_03350, partial [Acidimicrobiia bacterium]
MSQYSGFAGRVDIRHLLTWTSAMVVGLLVPQRWSASIISARVKARQKRNPNLIPALAGLMEEYLGPSTVIDYEAEALEYELRLAELQWGRVRDLTGRRWPIATIVEGIDRLDSALLSHTGVILWH